MNKNYYYNNIPLSKILHTTDSSSRYYDNMSLEDAYINPLSAAFPFGYTLPTGSFPARDDNSYREATYTDYVYSGRVTPPQWATHFSAILIGQGGQGGGGGGGYYQIIDGYKPYYSGTHGQNGTAGKAVVIPNTEITDDDIEISVVGADAFSNNKGSTGSQNRNQSNALGTSGTAGVNGLSTTLTHNGTTYTGYGGTGGAGGGRWTGAGFRAFYGYPTYYPINQSPYPTPASFTPINGNNKYTAVMPQQWWRGTGGIGGNGGYGTGGYDKPVTIGNPENGTTGYRGICRIYWKRY